MTPLLHSLGALVRFWTPDAMYISLGNNPTKRQAAWRSIVDEALDAETITRILHCANTGLVLGTEEFRAQVAAVTN